jgi:hypothetical protein
MDGGIILGLFDPKGKIMGRRSNYKELMRKLVEEYRESGQPWPATRMQMARWIIRNNRWTRGEESLVKLCARDIAEALREEFLTDPQGRRVRAKHAAKFPAPGTEDGQKTLWDDIRTAVRPFMERAFQGRRGQIVGDCVQLNTDVNSYNENKCPDKPIPMLFDFRDDVAEAEQADRKVAKTISDNVFEGTDLATEGYSPFALQEPESKAPDDEILVSSAVTLSSQIKSH